MDAARFDALARSVTVTTSRRTLLRRVALGAALLGGAALGDDAAAKKKNKKKNKSKGNLCSSNGSRCTKKGKTCKAGNCLQIPFTIEATWGNSSSDHDTFMFVPNAPGATLPFPYLDYGCRSSDTGAGGLYPFAFVSKDAQGPGPEITTVVFLMDGNYEYWINLDYPTLAAELTVTLRNPNNTVIRSWSSPANPGQPKRGWHVFDIQGASKSVTSINQLGDSTLAGVAHTANTKVCP